MSVAEDPSRLEDEGAALIDLGRPEAALGVLDRASALDPDAMRPHALRATALIALNRFEEATLAAAAAITREPEVAFAHRLLAIGQLKTGSEKAARQTALHSVALDPDDALNYIVLAEALQTTRDEAGAIAAIRHAIELEPQEWLSHDLHGRLLLDHERPRAAEAAFRRALALNPENETSLNNLSLALAVQGRRDEAAAGMDAATQIDPGDELVRRNTLLIARRHMAWLRGAGMAVAILMVPFVVAVVIEDGLTLGGMVFCAVVLLLAFGLYELGIQLAARHASGPTRQLLLDDWHARRFKPWRWDWTWIARLRPWWWLALQRVPPPYALLLNIGAGLLVPVLLLGVPFSAWRAWRWNRRLNPGRGSWTAPQ